MIPYVVRQGDYLLKIAHRLGFDAEAVWNAPENAELKRTRDPAVLHPGDILLVPDTPKEPLPFSMGAANRYVATIPKVTVNLFFEDDGEPLADEPYVIEGLGEPVNATTGADGAISITAPVHVREVRVVCLRKNIAFPVRIGDMDPIDTPAGVRKRLEHLGAYSTPPLPEDFENPPDAAELDLRAIAAFQRAHGIEPSGVPDQATKDALMKEHGS